MVSGGFFFFCFFGVRLFRKIARDISIPLAGALGRGRTRGASGAHGENPLLTRARCHARRSRPDTANSTGQREAREGRAIKEALRLPVLKAIGILGRRRFADNRRHADVADWLTCSMPAAERIQPSGRQRAQRFDWTLLTISMPRPARHAIGRARPQNVGEAIALAGPPPGAMGGGGGEGGGGVGAGGWVGGGGRGGTGGVDVSSGVDDLPA